MKQTQKKSLITGLTRVRNGNYGKGSLDLRTTIPEKLWKRLDSLLGFKRGAGKASTFVALFIEVGLALVDENQNNLEIEAAAGKIIDMVSGNNELFSTMCLNLEILSNQVTAASKRMRK